MNACLKQTGFGISECKSYQDWILKLKGYDNERHRTYINQFGQKNIDIGDLKNENKILRSRVTFYGKFKLPFKYDN